MSKKKFKLGFLSSYGGTNMQAIIDACKDGKLNMVPAVIISNNYGSEALERARKENVPYFYLNSKTHPDEKKLDEEIKNTLIQHDVDIVILAGYMKKIGKETLAYYKGRILNIHPALLPKFGGKGMYGLNVHKAVIAGKEKETGITIHLVDDKYDHGKILAQIKIPVYEDDTPEILQKRVLKEEHKIYADTLTKICSGEIKLD